MQKKLDEKKKNNNSTNAEASGACIVRFPSNRNDLTYIGIKPNFTSEKMDVDCLQCLHVWIDSQNSYYCDLINDECYFEEI